MFSILANILNSECCGTICNLIKPLGTESLSSFSKHFLSYSEPVIRGCYQKQKICFSIDNRMRAQIPISCRTPKTYCSSIAKYFPANNMNWHRMSEILWPRYPQGNRDIQPKPNCKDNNNSNHNNQTKTKITKLNGMHDEPSLSSIPSGRLNARSCSCCATLCYAIAN